jgi:lipopolysaccharide biosynthesis glycosyltransferase
MNEDSNDKKQFPGYCMSNIKIFVSHHKDSETLSSNIITPIQVNAAKAEKKLDMMGDDTGDHISHKNSSFCELTAQYWVWKNYNAEYYGFMHYRRHFIFSDLQMRDDITHMVHFPSIDSEYLEKCGLTDHIIEEFIEGYDCIVPHMVDVGLFRLPISRLHQLNNRTQFPEIKYQYLENFDIAMEVVKEIYPDYTPEVDEFVNSSKAYWYNMYIMKKELFNTYNEWVFPILFEIEQRVDHSRYSIDEMRFIGFLAERLFSIFMIRIKKENRYKIRHLQISFIEDTTQCENLTPYFNTHYIPIITSSNDRYFPFIGTMITSLLENSSKDYNYDIIIMSQTSQLSESNISRLKDMMKAYPHAKVRFYNISSFLSSITLYTPRLFQPETYYRLFIPIIFSHYDKVIYLDGDIIVNSDISEIFEVHIDNYLLGAVQDSIAAGAMLSPLFNLKNYFENTLKLQNPYNYFQAGVMLMNLKEFRIQKLGPQMIEYASNHECMLVDQDVLNLYCQGQVQFLDASWNVDCNKIGPEVAKCAPLHIYNDFLSARKNPKLFHYAGDNKPWNCLDLDFSHYFWKYARLTPWYENMIIPAKHVEELRPETKIFRKFRSLWYIIEHIAERYMPYGSFRRKCGGIGYIYGAVGKKYLKKIIPSAFI